MERPSSQKPAKSRKIPSPKAISKKAFKVVPLSTALAVNDTEAAGGPIRALDPQYVARQMETEAAGGRYVELKRFDDSDTIPTFTGIITMKAFGEQPAVYELSEAAGKTELQPADEYQRIEVMHMLNMLDKQGFEIPFETVAPFLGNAALGEIMSVLPIK